MGHCKPWDPIATATLFTLIDTNLCKPDDGQARPKHVADVTSCILQLVTSAVEYNCQLCCAKTV